MIDVIESFAERQPGGGILTVTRKVTASPAYVNGYPVTAASMSTFTVVAQVVPVSARDMRTLADQQTVGEMRSLLSGTALIARDKTREPDRLTGVDLDPIDDGSVWIVIKSEHFDAPDGERHYHAIVAKDATE